MTLNRHAIRFNNHALDDLHGRGDLIAAYVTLSAAVSALGLSSSDHDRNETEAQASVLAAAYSYKWVKCSSESFYKRLSPYANEGHLPFMFLRFLRIQTHEGASEIDFDSHCPCQFSWAIHYNFGLLCTVLGTLLGRQDRFAALSQYMLGQGRSLMDSVLLRASTEQIPGSKDWAMVHLFILVNQALGDLEHMMGQAPTRPTEANGRAAIGGGDVNIGGQDEDQQRAAYRELLLSHIQRVQLSLQSYSQHLKFEDLIEVHFSLHQLLSDQCAQAA